jgi:hypothetical protein
MSCRSMTRLRPSEHVGRLSSEECISVGSVATAEWERRERLIRGQLCGKNFELLCQGWIRIEGVPRLSLAHHVDHFDAG